MELGAIHQMHAATPEVAFDHKESFTLADLKVSEGWESGRWLNDGAHATSNAGHSHTRRQQHGLAAPCRDPHR
jgi:hypothetical protein